MERETNINPYDQPQAPSETFSPPLWQWQSGPSPDPWREKDPSKWSWQAYSDSDCLIIEQAFALNKDLADLNDNYEIDLKKMLQVNKKDKNRIRRVRRQEKSRFMMKIPKPEVLPKDEKSFGNLQNFLEYLFRKAPEAYGFYQRLIKLSLDSKDNDIIEEVLMSLEKVPEAKSLITLLKDKSTNLKDFLKAVLKVHMTESSLFYMVNELLKGEKWEEIFFLVPYLISLVFSFKLPEHIIHYQEEPQGFMKSLVRIVVKPKLELYKGGALRKEDLYNTEKIKYFSWKGINSVSKERNIAMNFVKLSLKKDPSHVPVLFVIQAEYDQEGVIDVSQISRFPEEKEVILAPGTVFKLLKVRLTEENIHEIHLKITGKSEESLPTLKSSQDGAYAIEELPSQKSLKFLESLKQTKLIRKLEIRNSEIDENLIEEIANLNIQNIKIAGNTLILSSLSELARCFGEEKMDDLLMLNKIRFKEKKKNPPKEALTKLNLTKEVLQKFSQLKPLWKDIKTSIHLTTLNISMKEPYRTDPNEEFFDMVDCTSPLKSLENLTLALHRTDSPENLPFLFKTIASLTSLKQLSLQLILTSEELPHLTNSLSDLTNLQNLSLNFENSYGLSDSSIHSLKNLPAKSLKSLSLNFTMCGVSDFGLESLLNSFTELLSVSLNFEYCNKITDHALKILQPITSLQTLMLNFGKCSQITDEGLTHLTNTLITFNSLKDLTLDFNECTNISDEGLRSIKESFRNITKISLNLRRCSKISSIWFVYLYNSFPKSLEKLSLNFTECEKLTDGAFDSLLNNLRFVVHLSLNFSSCNHISDQGLKFLEKGLSFMKGLQYLSLDFLGCEKISDKGLISIKNSLIALPDLRYLSLNFSHCNSITDEGLNQVISGVVYLKSLKHLSLNFGKCYRITNKGLNNLKNALIKLPNLEYFSFECTNSPYITDEGLGDVKIGVMALTNLRHLKICFWGCREISDEARDQFGKGLKPLVSLEVE